MKQLQYSVRFVTPAFIGNADQDGQWRTPPFKALLRQWWRVAFAADQVDAVDVGAMRAAEGKLFGVAADRDGDSRKSEVRIRLNCWDKGRLTAWAGQDSERVMHQEVKSRDGRPAPVGAQLYLGYGPLNFDRDSRQTALKARAAIQVGEQAVLSLAFPSGAEASRLETALSLMQRYGTLGGRSRNGWGSFSLTPVDASTPALQADLDARLTSHWQDALKLDWPHAIGTSDGKPLIWQTEALPDWTAVMRRLAELKIGLRTQFKFTSGRDAAQPEERHWLSYPVTNHNVAAWRERGKGEFRLPNSLRFKVRADADGQLRGVIFHMPCQPPKQFKPDLAAIQAVWRQVHAHLDHADRQLTRLLA